MDSTLCILTTFFTSFDLLCHLTKSGFYACGTTRENQTGGCPLQSKKTAESKERGWYEEKFQANKKICITRWNNNKAVTVGSNVLGAEPSHTAVRYNRKERKHVQIKQPNVMKQYNKHMGSVDLADNMVANYRIGIRGKKMVVAYFFKLR